MEKEKNILDSINTSQNPFKVPEGYFSAFPKVLKNKIEDMHPQDEVKRPLFQKIRPWIYIAASFLLFGLFTQVYVINRAKSDKIAENPEIMELMEEEPAILYAYLDDLMIIDYLISEDE